MMEPRDTGNRHVETREFVDGATVPDTSRAQSFPGKERKKKDQTFSNQKWVMVSSGKKSVTKSGDHTRSRIWILLSSHNETHKLGSC